MLKNQEYRLNELALFAGAGGGILAGQSLGWRTVCAVEYDSYAASILVARQDDGCLEPFPVWDDVRTFDGRAWQGVVDIVSGGFPCQDISSAGKGEGISGQRSGLWAEMARIIREVQPRYVYVENSPMLTSRGLDRVLGDLAQIGYDAAWGVLGADDIGANHIRKRIWIYACHSDFNSKSVAPKNDKASRMPDVLANSIGKRARSDNRGVWTKTTRAGRGSQADTSEKRKHTASIQTGKLRKAANSSKGRFSGPMSTQEAKPDADVEERPQVAQWWAVEPSLGRVANGVAHRVDRLKAIGNGQVPAVAAAAFRMLKQKL